MVSPDYEDLFKTLNAFKIKYLVVGAHAVIFHSEPRFTKDMDVWIPMELNDSEAVYEALKAFGAPLKQMTPENFQDPNMIFQMGVIPVRIDIMVNLPGVDASTAWENKKRNRYGRTPIHVLGKNELIKSKKAAGRSQDKLDIERLQIKSKRKR